MGVASILIALAFFGVSSTAVILVTLWLIGKQTTAGEMNK